MKCFTFCSDICREGLQTCSVCSESEHFEPLARPGTEHPGRTSEPCTAARTRMDPEIKMDYLSKSSSVLK